MAEQENKTENVDALKNASGAAVDDSSGNNKEEDLDFLVDSAFNDACAPGNPKDATKEDIRALYLSLM